MNIIKLGLVATSALVAATSFAQFGAASKADFGADGTGTYVVFNPFVRATGGGSSVNGYQLSFEKMQGEGDKAMVVGGWFGSIDSTNAYQLHVRKAMSNFDLQFALIKTEFGGNGLDFSLLAFKELESSGGASGIRASVFGGLYRTSFDNKINLSAGIKANHALQNNWSVDATFWYIAQSPSLNFMSLGLGYRF